MKENAAGAYAPLPAEEVLRIVASAWGYEVEGKNWFGYGPRIILDADDVDALAEQDPALEHRPEECFRKTERRTNFGFSPTDLSALVRRRARRRVRL